jgi:hypothetical protein
VSPPAPITPLSGFPEWLPEQRMVEQQLLDRIRRLAELYGFVPLETRSDGSRARTTTAAASACTST